MIYDFERLQFQILGVLQVEHPSGFFKVRGRPYAALSFRVSGTGEFLFGEKNIVSNPGDILFIPENISYDVSYSGGTMIVVHFVECNYHIPENIVFHNSAYISEIFVKLLRDWESTHSVYASKAAVYSVMQFCYESHRKDAASQNAELAKQLIDSNFQNPKFNIEALVQMIYTSYPTLRRNFLKRFGISLKQYLLKVRFDTAVSMLSEGFLSVQEVAQKCGFDDARYFSQIFKERYGISPSKVSHTPR